MLFYSKYISPMLLDIGTILTWTQLVDFDIGLHLWKQRVGISEAGPCNSPPHLFSLPFTSDILCLLSWLPPTTTQTMELLRVCLRSLLRRVLV